MGPFSFLKEECSSVRAALNETLRHDYGPERSRAYFDECQTRLRAIEQEITDDPKMDRQSIAAHMRALSSLGSRISLIERSHLGEFSWPFAEVIRNIADKLFVEEQIDGFHPPIVHVVAEGMDYQIVDDDIHGGMRRIVIVAFPRQLKHHVLLHAIFGHELAHIAISVQGPGFTIVTTVMPILATGPLQDGTQILQWLRREDAPASIASELREAPDYSFPEHALTNWRNEIVCDLFGLLLFGPAFAAAHRTIIEALCAHPDSFDLESSTHPPYPIRQRILTTAIRVLGWDKPVTAPENEAHEAELELLDYVTAGPDGPWYDLLTKDQIRRILEALGPILADHQGLAFVPPDPIVLGELFHRLSLERPPICQALDEDGVATNEAVTTAHCLYAGWCFWLGLGKRQAVTELAAGEESLDFLLVNRLCDHAILQQGAIDLVGRGTT